MRHPGLPWEFNDTAVATENSMHTKWFLKLKVQQAIVTDQI